MIPPEKRIWSRNRLPLEQKFPSITSAVEELNLHSTILDAEIVASDDPEFEEKVADIIGLYLEPPVNAAVFCVGDIVKSRVWEEGASSVNNG